MEVNIKLLHLLKVVKPKRWILRYIKKYLCLRLHITATTALIVMMPQTHRCLLLESHTWKVKALKKILQLSKHLISYQCFLLPPMDLWIGYNHDLCITWLNTQSGFLPISWLFFSLSSGHCSIAAFLYLAFWPMDCTCFGLSGGGVKG